MANMIIVTVRLDIYFINYSPFKALKLALRSSYVMLLASVFPTHSGIS